MQNVIIDTKYYEAEHGGKPHHNKRGDWTFLTPRKNRRWQFSELSYKDACDALTEQASKNEGDGSYTLLP